MMKSQFSMNTMLEEDMMDILSSPTNNSGPLSGGEPTPSRSGNFPFEDGDSSSVTSKKIRKKRNTYQKIDDDIRLKLLEAVQNGETLKAVAKRCNINYSSAKSILHTYRKEGRILKKSGQEKTFDGVSAPTTHQTPQLAQMSQQKLPMNQCFPLQFNQNFPFQHQPHQQPFNGIDINRMEFDNGMRPSLNFGPGMNSQFMTPNQDLMTSFMNMLKIGSNNNNNNNNNNSMNNNGMSLEESTRAKPLPQGFGFMPFNQFQNNGDMGQNTLNNFSGINNKPVGIRGIGMSPANGTSYNQMLQPSPIEKIKTFDGFYMNYSNSPLSGGGRMMNDNTDSSAKNNSALPKEFESFSDMVNAIQGLPNQPDEIYVPHPVRYNTAQIMQDRIESQINNNNIKDESGWNDTMDNATMDTYKTFADAHFMVQDALKRVSYLNNLVHIQKGKPEAGLMSEQLLNSKVS